jgi:hypothetical protein
MFGIIATVLGLILSCIYYCCCYRRRRTGQQKKGVEINVTCSSTGNVTETRQESYEYKESKTADTTDKWRPSIRTKETGSHREPPRSTKKDRTAIKDWNSDGDVDDGDFNWDNYNKSYHKRDIESGGHSREEEYERRKKRRERRLKEAASGGDISEPKRKSSRRLLECEDRERSTKIKAKRRSIEAWHEEEKRRNSDRSLEVSDSREHEETQRRRKRKKEKPPAVEESMRKARTVLEDVESNKGSGTVKVTLVPALREVIDLLEEEKKKLESRQKKVEEEKIRLKVEVESSKKYLSELHESNETSKTELARAKMNKGIIQAGSRKIISDTVGKRKEIKKALGTIRVEKEEMSQLLDTLKQREAEIQHKVQDSEDLKHSLLHERENMAIELALASISKAEEHKQIQQASVELTARFHRADEGYVSMLIPLEEELGEMEDSVVVESLFIAQQEEFEVPPDIGCAITEAYRTEGEPLHLRDLDQVRNLEEAVFLEEHILEAQRETHGMLAKLAELSACKRDLQSKLIYAQNDSGSDASSSTSPTCCNPMLSSYSTSGLHESFPRGMQQGAADMHGASPLSSTGFFPSEVKMHHSHSTLESGIMRHSYSNPNMNGLPITVDLNSKHLLQEYYDRKSPRTSDTEENSCQRVIQRAGSDRSLHDYIRNTSQGCLQDYFQDGSDPPALYDDTSYERCHERCREGE